jgi:hemoglobin-like flavoprotein
MDIREIEVIQKSYKSIQPRMLRVTRVIFDRLFELQPELRSLFSSDLRGFRRKLVKKIDYIIQNLDQPEVIDPELKALGKMYSERLNVSEKDYPKYMEAFIYALAAALGNDFTPELRKTWVYTLGIVVKVMQSGVKK